MTFQTSSYTRGTLWQVSDYLDRVYSPEEPCNVPDAVGIKGSGQFERISWDTALDEIPPVFKKLLQYGSEAIMPCSYLGHERLSPNGLTVGMLFLIDWALPSVSVLSAFQVTQPQLTYGPFHGTDPDTFIHSKYIILWNCQCAGTNIMAVYQEARGNGAKLVVIDRFAPHRKKQTGIFPYLAPMVRLLWG